MKDRRNALGRIDYMLTIQSEDYFEKGSCMCENACITWFVVQRIGLWEKKMLKKILMEIVTAKYFSLIIDSTPDISHVDQLTIVIRYVLPHGSTVERFLNFISNISHKSEQVTNAVTSTLTEFGIDISNCRGQSYDKAANMAGIYSGLQAKIKEISPLAEYL
ncbi:protein of unknown function (DUF4371) [Popillia japonica]|uniref:DUF4371 domain-containing protein n=1 Tax=Popillia japonica TaxID=7064 RepID=A0AAW1JG16_POPJA